MTPPPDPLEQVSTIVRRRRSELLRVAQAEGLGPEDALESVQDALCRYITLTADGPLPEDRAVARLKTMIKNDARNARRRHHRSRAHLPLTDAPLASTSEDPEAHLAYAEDVVRLRGCVAELCSIQRAVVLLRLLEERSGQDVAGEVGLTRAHVDVLLSRARASLKVCMRPPRQGD